MDGWKDGLIEIYLKLEMNFFSQRNKTRGCDRKTFSDGKFTSFHLFTIFNLNFTCELDFESCMRGDKIGVI